MRWLGLTCYRSRRFKRTYRLLMRGRGLISRRNEASHLLYKSNRLLFLSLIITTTSRGNSNHSRTSRSKNTTSTCKNLDLHRFLGTGPNFKTRTQLLKLQRLDAEILMLPIRRILFRSSQRIMAFPLSKTSPLRYPHNALTKVTVRKWSTSTAWGHLLCQALFALGLKSCLTALKGTLCSLCNRQTGSLMHIKS